jgi:predicted RNase H-like HicB family nuclease
MKVVYPVIISKGKNHLIASVPDCNIDTQGNDIINAIEMARDAISIWCVAEQGAGRTLPKPTDITGINCEEDELVTLVDSDIEAYKRRLDERTVRKNLTLPSWLNEEAEKAGINFSQLLQASLKENLGIAQ